MIFFPFVQSLLVLYSFLLNSCYVVLIPHGVINHGGDKPWCIHRERYSIRGRLENHLYYLRHVRVLSIKPCLHTQLPEHKRSYWKSFPGVGAFDHLEWTCNGAFEQLYSLGRGNFQKNKCPGCCPGGMFKLRFDSYILKWHYQADSWGEWRKLSTRISTELTPNSHNNY